MYYLFGKNVEPNRHLCAQCLYVFLVDNKMANISLDVHPKYRFQFSLDYTFLSLSVYPLSSCKRKSGIFVI